MLFSQHVWNQTEGIYQAIIHHPFNQKLMHGTLEREKFSFYIEQDSLYLKDFARCHALIASQVPLPYMQIFLGYAGHALMVEQSAVHQFFKATYGFKETGVLTPATISYTNYLLRVCAMEPFEVGIAAILPCFWIYREVGVYIAKHSVANNPFARWIETYSSEDFSKSVDSAIEIFNGIASNANDITRQKMMDAYCRSSVLEWYFWNDAYEERDFYAIAVDTTAKREPPHF